MKHWTRVSYIALTFWVGVAILSALAILTQVAQGGNQWPCLAVMVLVVVGLTYALVHDVMKGEK